MTHAYPVHYERLSLFFAAIMAVLFWGLYKTYLVFFPGFQNFRFAQQFHGALMVTWMLFLIIQPLLIRSGKYRLHKTVGWLSYVVAPLLVFSIFLVLQMGYYRNITTIPKQETIAFLTLELPDAVAFAALYSLAVANKHETPKHMRYMIGTSLLMIGPGLGRAFISYFNIPFAAAASFSNFAAIAVAAPFFLVDVFKKRNAIPNAIILIILFLTYMPWEFRYSDAWQAMGTWFANLFF